MMHSNKLYIGIATSKSSALSINTFLIFKKQLVNGEFFLKKKPLVRSLVSLSFVSFTAAVFAAALAVFICSAVLLLGNIILGKSSSGKWLSP